MPVLIRVCLGRQGHRCHNLRNVSLVSLLLEAAADAACKESRVPPLITAVLYQDLKIIALLLGARADPWQETSFGAIQDRQWNRWDFACREYVNAARIAAAQTSEYNCLSSLVHEDHGGHWPKQSVPPVLTVLSERATNSLLRVIEEYKRRTGLYKPQCGHESLYWRKIMAGLCLPPRSPFVKQPTADRNTLRGWLYQYD